MHKLVPSEIESQMNIIFEIKQKKSQNQLGLNPQVRRMRRIEG